MANVVNPLQVVPGAIYEVTTALNPPYAIVRESNGIEKSLTSAYFLLKYAITFLFTESR